MFLGTHAPRLDEKGRLILPAKYREELAGGVVITKGQERCLYVFPQEEFTRITEALRLRPSFVEAHFNLAQALTSQGRPRDGVEQYREALRLRPDWEPALIGLSWMLSANADAALRNPDEAVRLATGRATPALSRGQQQRSIPPLQLPCSADS